MSPLWYVFIIHEYVNVDSGMLLFSSSTNRSSELNNQNKTLSFELRGKRVEPLAINSSQKPQEFCYCFYDQKYNKFQYLRK
jgi:hypothetical protein